MNQLSWFVYLADVVTSAGTIIGIGTAFAIVGWLGAWFVYALASEYEGEKRRAEMAANRNKVTRTAMIFIFIAVPFLVFLPNKNTMYAIAASEMGEQLSKTEIANDAMKALHSWIKKQLKEEPAK